MLTELKLCITAFVLMLLFCALFLMFTAGKKPKAVNKVDGVISLSLVVCFIVFVVSGIAGVWQL